jgi:hypothetical protein
VSILHRCAVNVGATLAVVHGSIAWRCGHAFWSL